MRIVTKSVIDVSESLAAFITASYIHQSRGCDPIFEKRMSHVNTAKFTIADIYLPKRDVAFEVKSIEHGNSALKGVIQSSIYKEQVDNSVFVMQKPRREALEKAIESMCEEHGVGVIWIIGIPNICSEQMITNATGGCSKPFELWKQRRYSMTKTAIKGKSRSGWSDEFISTLEQTIIEKSSEIFEFSVKPNADKGGFSDIYWSD